MVELVEEDIRDFLKGRALENAPVVAVSATTGENLDLLKSMLRDLSTGIEERSREGIFRLPVDRVFTLRGLGPLSRGPVFQGAFPLERKWSCSLSAGRPGCAAYRLITRM
jgi:selenocysteine-specific elongation factor